MAEVRYISNRSPADRPRPARRSRFAFYVGGFAVLDVVIFVLAAHSWSTYHPDPKRGDPTVMPVSTLLSFFIAVGLLIGLGMVLMARRQGRRHR